MYEHDLLNAAVIRSLAAIDRSRNIRQAAVLLKHYHQMLIQDLNSCRKNNELMVQAVREACDRLVSSSFTAIEQTGKVLEHWAPMPQPTPIIDLQLPQRSQVQTITSSGPGQRHGVKQPGKAADEPAEIKLCG